MLRCLQNPLYLCKCSVGTQLTVQYCNGNSEKGENKTVVGNATSFVIEFSLHSQPLSHCRLFSLQTATHRRLECGATASGTVAIAVLTVPLCSAEWTFRLQESRGAAGLPTPSKGSGPRQKTPKRPGSAHNSHVLIADLQQSIGVVTVLCRYGRLANVSRRHFASVGRLVVSSFGRGAVGDGQRMSVRIGDFRAIQICRSTSTKSVRSRPIRYVRVAGELHFHPVHIN